MRWNDQFDHCQGADTNTDTPSSAEPIVKTDVYKKKIKTLCRMFEPFLKKNDLMT